MQGVAEDDLTGGPEAAPPAASSCGEGRGDPGWNHKTGDQKSCLLSACTQLPAAASHDAIHINGGAEGRRYNLLKQV